MNKNKADLRACWPHFFIFVSYAHKSLKFELNFELCAELKKYSYFLKIMLINF